MSFLRRLFGVGGTADEVAGGSSGEDDADEVAAAEADDPGASPDELEHQREREMLRLEAERLDELQQRQLRFADRAWTPPAQGGERRADDADPAARGD
jgi:hypothetical protein